MKRRDFLAAAGVAVVPMPAVSASSARVRIAAYPTVVSAAPLFGAASGVFARHGLDVEVSVIPPASRPVELFAAGYDVLCGVHIYAGAALALTSAYRPRFVAFNGYNNRYVFDVLVSRPDLPIRAVSDLAGRRALISDAAANRVFIEWILQRSGIPDERLPTLIPAPSSRFSELLAAGMADAAFCLEPWGSHLMEFHGMRVAETALLSRYLFDDEEALAFFGGILASGRFLASRPEAAAALVTAWKDVIGAVIGDRETRVRAVRLVFPDLRIASTVGMVRTVPLRDMAAQELRQVQESLDFGQRMGFVPGAVDVTSISIAA